MCTYGENGKEGTGNRDRDRQTETKRWGNQMWVLSMVIFKVLARADLLK